MSRPAVRITPGNAYAALSLAYNYVEYRDLLRGLQLCRRLRRDLPDYITRINATHMAQAGLEFMARNFKHLEELVIIQANPKPYPLLGPDKALSVSSDDSSYCGYARAELSLSVSEPQEEYQKRFWRACRLDFSQMRLPSLRRLAIKRSPLFTMSFNTRNTPALTHLRVHGNRVVPDCYMGARVLNLKLPNLLYLKLEKACLNSAIGFMQSLAACPQLMLVDLYRVRCLDNLQQRVVQLSLPNCRRFQINGYAPGGIHLSAPKLRSLSLTCCGNLYSVKLEPPSGPRVLIDIEGSKVKESETVRHLQDHPRVGRARVLNAGHARPSIWDPLPPDCEQPKSAKIAGLDMDWEPDGWCAPLGPYESIMDGLGPYHLNRVPWEGTAQDGEGGGSTEKERERDTKILENEEEEEEVSAAGHGVRRQLFPTLQRAGAGNPMATQPTGGGGGGAGQHGNGAVAPGVKTTAMHGAVHPAERMAPGGTRQYGQVQPKYGNAIGVGGSGSSSGSSSGSGSGGVNIQLGTTNLRPNAPRCLSEAAPANGDASDVATSVQQHQSRAWAVMPAWGQRGIASGTSVFNPVGLPLPRLAPGNSSDGQKGLMPGAIQPCAFQAQGAAALLSGCSAGTVNLTHTQQQQQQQLQQQQLPLLAAVHVSGAIGPSAFQGACSRRPNGLLWMDGELGAAAGALALPPPCLAVMGSRATFSDMDRGSTTGPSTAVLPTTLMLPGIMTSGAVPPSQLFPSVSQQHQLQQHQLQVPGCEPVVATADMSIGAVALLEPGMPGISSMLQAWEEMLEMMIVLKQEMVQQTQAVTQYVEELLKQVQEQQYQQRQQQQYQQ